MHKNRRPRQLFVGSRGEASGRDFPIFVDACAECERVHERIRRFVRREIERIGPGRYVADVGLNECNGDLSYEPFARKNPLEAFRRCGGIEGAPIDPGPGSRSTNGTCRADTRERTQAGCEKPCGLSATHPFQPVTRIDRGRRRSSTPTPRQVAMAFR
ncbi:PALP domain-containing protein [Burkholderia alba]|uniref:hypothetical protein n=1 Tax=Burkholderia alba TaxID=2683677 RepID=UPI002B05678D|nr:hypothetical protein [Burkholderia alba]